MKGMRNKIHPELNITAKNLRERAMRIINKKLIQETGLILEQQEKIQELSQDENRASNTDAPEKNSETNKENMEEGHVPDTETLEQKTTTATWTEKKKLKSSEL